MTGIFISYRRQDSAGHAGRLYDRLVKEFGADQVFIDVEHIASGDEFDHVIGDTLSSCDVCIVVIGRGWLTSADEHGRRRLDKRDDFVRMEIAAALTRNVRVIPLLVDGASLPLAEALPGDLIRLPSLQAHEIHHYTFHPDVDRLIAGIKAAVESRKTTLGLAAALDAGTVRVSSRDGLEYAWIPPGDFLMGRLPGDAAPDERFEDEKPQHPVRLTRGFWLTRGPVTVAAYRRFTLDRRIEMPRPPKHNPNWVNQDHPVVNVTWAQARDYCAWVGGRLPTEAQWEYAARGGEAKTIYPWGDDIRPDRASYLENRSRTFTSKVGAFPANGFNLYDMVGNVWEWVADWYDEELYSSRPPHQPTIDPQVFVNKTGKRVVRGGSCDSIAPELRTSNRGYQTPADGFRDFGFRCLLDDVT